MMTVNSIGGSAPGAPSVPPLPPPPQYDPQRVSDSVGRPYEVPEHLKGQPEASGHDKTTQEAVTEISRDKVEQTVKELNQGLQELGNRLAFDLYEGTNEFYAKLIDRRTNEVVKSMPPKEILEMHAKFREVIGRILDEKA